MAIIITLLLVGAVLLLLETLLPGLIAGTVGFCCLVAAVVKGYVDFGPQTGNTLLAIVVVGLVIGTMAWIKYLPESRVARLFISKGQVGSIGTDRPMLLHQTGTALTSLRPSGMALINNERVDVVTEGEMIERGTPVKVVSIEGMRVVVRAVN